MNISRHGTLCALCLALAACDAGGFADSGPYAPPVDTRAQAVDGLVVGHRLMAAGEYELALRAYTRAAAEKGMVPEVLSGLGTANLKLGRLGQAERLLRRATEADAENPATWNNLGVLLMERGEPAQAVPIFRQAFALDNGRSDSIRDNLRLALAKSADPGYADPNNNSFKLIRRGSSDFLITATP